MLAWTRTGHFRHHDKIFIRIKFRVAFILPVLSVIVDSPRRLLFGSGRPCDWLSFRDDRVRVCGCSVCFARTELFFRGPRSVSMSRSAGPRTISLHARKQARLAGAETCGRHLFIERPYLRTLRTVWRTSPAYFYQWTITLTDDIDSILTGLSAQPFAHSISYTGIECVGDWPQSTTFLSTPLRW